MSLILFFAVESLVQQEGEFRTFNLVSVEKQTSVFGRAINQGRD